MFDFNQVLENANQALQGNGEGGGYRYKLVYPGQGTLTVKFLFNPKSNIVLRLINRHTIGDKKIPCMRTFNKDCPICKSLANIKNARGTDLVKLRSVTRGIAFAQIVNSSYKLQNDVNPGDVVLLMFPWTVYKELSQQFSKVNSSEQLAEFIASNTGYTFDIVRGTDNKYSVQLNPFQKYTSCSSDEEFMAMLNNLEPLSDQVVKDPLPEDVYKTVVQASQELDQQYLTHRSNEQYMNNPGNQQVTNLGNNFGFSNNQPTMNMYDPNVGYKTVPVGQGNFSQPSTNNNFVNEQQFGQVQTQEVSQATQQTPPQMNPMSQSDPSTISVGQDNKPDCFGKHGTEDINKCLLCPLELSCQNVSK